MEEIRRKGGRLGTERSIYVRQGKPGQQAYLYLPAGWAQGQPEIKIYLGAFADRAKVDTVLRRICSIRLNSQAGGEALARLNAETVLGGLVSPLWIAPRQNAEFQAAG